MTDNAADDHRAKEAPELQQDDVDEAVKALKTNLQMGDTGPDEEEEEEEDVKGDGGYRCDTPQHIAEIKRQRTVMWNWLKEVGASVVREGFSIDKFALPVALFEPRSGLERIINSWNYSDLLVKAAECQDPVDRMKYVIGFAIAGLSQQISFQKPFDPILGETLHVRHPNGVEVYLEQISLQPVTVSWQLIGPGDKFRMHGTGRVFADLKGNTARAWQTGPTHVVFKDGSEISYNLPVMLIRGVLWGQRFIKHQGELKFRDEQNGLSCDVLVDPEPNQGWVSSFFRSKRAAGYKPDIVKGELKKGSTVLDTLSGTWLHHFEWEKGVEGMGRRMWDSKRSQPAEALPAESPAPSDFRFREDLVHLKAGDVGKAQEWKTRLEGVQRADRKLRKEGGGYIEH